MKHLSTLFILWSFTSSLITAQTAPDFTVTDVDGQVHHLYADYLNQGKTVMIKIMFTTCPPCNSIAPLMEPFYQEWGAGDYDVEFFEMTDKSFDTNSLMAAYADQYDETFPAISMQGNSLPTVQPYKNGTFGPWFGTPTFLVIAPDGTVQFNVDGANNQATIDAIDAALTATGAQKPNQQVLAPDFTVTDSHGDVHHLYADYLNQGKSVLLEIFYTTCPPCNSIAPLMEPFYQEWGAGDYDVEFFELSDKNFDTDALVNAYQAQYSETFIGVGKDGGSLAAVAPYKSGQFGPWYGTPTYVVIAPDGTFQYDVDGANNAATIAALDEALLATGAEKPEPVLVAPDFIITDSHDQTHQLYGNYLNQGKTVLLEIFNTTCAPCTSIAPLLQPLYFEWGSGDYDIEFIQLSDKNFDSDALINNFQLNYGETFVGVGVEGGSLAAVAPYKNEQFGPWDDTPTYVVIAPDGTMQYDVHGANNNETIDAIDQAISLTGAVKPNLPLLAPDFNVTDSHGQQHLLYADYLTQGKTVLIEIFNTTCAPCISIAPLMEPFYQEWGAGEYDVEFIELSDKNFDTDALINAYQSQYGEMFIGVGKNGASLSTVVPYKSGLFGPWDDTPTFIVIAPDGTVQYDVQGISNQATIAALDSAIAATGAVKPVIEQPISINGNVHFLSGSAGVSNATVQIIDSSGNVIFSDVSEMNGNFNFSVLQSEVQPDWKVKVVKHGPPKNGVSTIDIVKIQKHLLILEPLDNPLAKLAADANNSGSISALDIIVLTKLLLGHIQNFNNGEEWITIPADTDFGPPNQQPPVIHETTIPLQDIINGTRQPNFIGIKKGDVNGNANPG